MEFDTVQELLIASCYLDNEILTDAWSAFIAYELKKTSIEKIENIYDISTHLSHSEIIEMMEKYKYLNMKDPSEYLQVI